MIWGWILLSGLVTEDPGYADLTPYLRRGHDVKLDDLIKTAADGGLGLCCAGRRFSDGENPGVV